METARWSKQHKIDIRFSHIAKGLNGINCVIIVHSGLFATVPHGRG